MNIWREWHIWSIAIQSTPLLFISPFIIDVQVDERSHNTTKEPEEKPLKSKDWHVWITAFPRSSDWREESLWSKEEKVKCVQVCRLDGKENAACNHCKNRFWAGFWNTEAPLTWKSGKSILVAPIADSKFFTTKSIQLIMTTPLFNSNGPGFFSTFLWDISLLSPMCSGSPSQKIIMNSGPCTIWDFGEVFPVVTP